MPLAAVCGSLPSFAGIEVVINRLKKRRAQTGDSFGVKSDDVRDAEDATDKDTVPVVVLDTGRVALVGHLAH